MQQPPPPPSSRSATEEEWEAATTTTGSEVVVMAAGGAAASVTAPPSVVSGFSKGTQSELAMVVSRNTKDLVEVIKELDEYFLRAADAGAQVSLLLEVPSTGFSHQNKASKNHKHGTNLEFIFFFCEDLQSWLFFFFPFLLLFVIHCSSWVFPPLKFSRILKDCVFVLVW